MIIVRPFVCKTQLTKKRVSGCIAAGLFLMLGRIPWLQVESNHAQLAPIDELKHHSAPHFWQRFLSSISLYQLDRPIREFAATAGILLVGFLPLAIYMPLWRVAYYVPIVTGITIGVAFLRTGLRQLGW